ncbi:MAG: hypothetical protein IH852_04355 [Bacteroidetes bacterium]|nr:hypothetical protein [Bacteroidota bacterium]
MKTKCKSILVMSFLLFVLFIVRCAPAPTTTTLIMFDNEIYPPTKSSKIVLYERRLELPTKYVEIGTIKFTGNPNLNDIKTQAAEKGAMGIILDGNNYILIRFEQKLEEESNETKTI